MSATIIAFPTTRVPSRAAIEAQVERSIEWLDAADLATVDCEPDVEEESDEGEVEAWQEWHTRRSLR